MNSYDENILKLAINQKVILVDRDNCVYVGHFVRDWNNFWRILGVDANNSMSFRRSDIKKLIYLRTGYALPKNINLNSNTKRHDKSLDIFELNELVNKAGCQFI